MAAMENPQQPDADAPGTNSVSARAVVQETANNAETGEDIAPVNNTETSQGGSVANDGLDNAHNSEAREVDNEHDNRVNDPEVDEADTNPQSPASSVTAGPNYLQLFRLKEYLVPHWRNVFTPGRVPWGGSILLLSFSHGAGIVSRQQLFKQQLMQLEESLTTMAAQSDLPQAVFVRDLSNRLMNSLGPAFDLSPEVFEEHLVQSGFTESSYEDPDSNTWPTRFLPKQQVSLRWLSPVLRKDMEPRDMVTRRHLLSNTLRWDRQMKARLWRRGSLLGSTRRLYTVANIFRQEWPLSAVYRPPKLRLKLGSDPFGDPRLFEIVDDKVGDVHKEAKNNTKQDLDVVAWEERVTFCWGKRGQERRRKSMDA